MRWDPYIPLHWGDRLLWVAEQYLLNWARDLHCGLWKKMKKNRQGTRVEEVSKSTCKKPHPMHAWYKTRTHLTRFCRLNEMLPPDFGYCTDSYILMQYVSKIYVQLIRSTYVLYDNKYLCTYFMTILLCRNCTSSYESDKIVRFSALIGILEIYKNFNKLVKNYIWTNFESVNLFKWPTSEVALCPLLPWYCVKLSWKV